LTDESFENEKLKLSKANLIRRKRMGRSSSLVRTLALRAKGRRFKSGSAHHLPFLLVESEVFAELRCENCVIRCFKWFSNVLLRLKPSSFDFETNSLSKYNTTFLLVLIANASEDMRGRTKY
jgi:hypothetical protein